MSQELLSIRKVADRISYSRSWIHAQIKTGNFPPPDLCMGKNLWRSETISNWIEGKLKNAAPE